MIKKGEELEIWEKFRFYTLSVKSQWQIQQKDNCLSFKYNTEATEMLDDILADLNGLVN